MQTLAKWISVRPLCFPFKDLSSPLLTVPMPVLIQVNGWQSYFSKLILQRHLHYNRGFWDTTVFQTVETLLTTCVQRYILF